MSESTLLDEQVKKYHYSLQRVFSLKTLVGLLYFSLPFFIAFEHANIHIFKRISKKVIPQGIVIPHWFSHRISFYLSDILILFLFFLTIYTYRLSIRRVLFEKKHLLLWGIFFLFFLSIVVSSFASYVTIYTRLLPIFTSLLLFFITKECGKRWLVYILYSLTIVGVIESLIAIAQYFHQAPIGVNFLGEQVSFALTGNLPSADGTRWILDKWLNIDIGKQSLSRAIGTFTDCNPLGGYLVFSSLATFALCMQSKRKTIFYLIIPILIFALFLTYSRSAIFTLIITAAIFFYRARPNKSFLLLIFFSFLLSTFLLKDQILQRGGIINYNHFVKASDTIRMNQRELAFEMIKRHPLTGVGFKQFTLNREFNDYSAENGIVLVHDSLLLLASETGIINAVLFLIFLFYSLYLSWRRAKSPQEMVLFSMALVFCLIGCTDFYPLEFQFSKILLFLSLGLIHATTKEENMLQQTHEG